MTFQITTVTLAPGSTQKATAATITNHLHDSASTPRLNPAHGHHPSDGDRGTCIYFDLNGLNLGLLIRPLTRTTLAAFTATPSTTRGPGVVLEATPTRNGGVSLDDTEENRHLLALALRRVTAAERKQKRREEHQHVLSEREG